MDTLQILSIEFLVGLQGALLVPLEWPMRALTFLGEELFYMIALTFLFWCVDRKLGFRLLFVLLATNYINVLGKWMHHRPRPYWFDPAVRGMVPETGYGPPSGHSQNPMALWAYAAAWLHTRGVRWFWPVAMAVVFLVGFSRMLLGVHFPYDLVLGWVIGAILAFATWRYSDRASAYFSEASETRRWFIALGVPAIMLILMVFTHRLFLDGVDPLFWAANAHRSQPDHVIEPHSFKAAVNSTAAMAGMLVSLILIRHTGEVSVDGPWSRRLGRFALGFAVLIAIHMGLGAIFPKDESVVALTLRFGRYFLMLIWGIWLAPIAFVKLGLAQKL